MIASLCWVLLFLFVPETFWDRSPRPKNHHKSKAHSISGSFIQRITHHKTEGVAQNDGSADVDSTGAVMTNAAPKTGATKGPVVSRAAMRSLHVGFVPGDDTTAETTGTNQLESHIDDTTAASGPTATEDNSGNKLKGEASGKSHRI